MVVVDVHFISWHPAHQNCTDLKMVFPAVLLLPWEAEKKYKI